MDKSKFAKITVILTIAYCVLAIISVACESIYTDLFSSNYQLAHSFYKAGSAMAPYILVVLPLLMVPTNLVLSIIGIIKSKKVLPYLLCPPVPVFLWFLTMATYARYI